MNEDMQGQPVPDVLGTDRPYPFYCEKMLEKAGNIRASFWPFQQLLIINDQLS